MWAVGFGGNMIVVGQSFSWGRTAKARAWPGRAGNLRAFINRHRSGLERTNCPTNAPRFSRIPDMKNHEKMHLSPQGQLGEVPSLKCDGIWCFGIPTIEKWYTLRKPLSGFQVSKVLASENLLLVTDVPWPLVSNPLLFFRCAFVR